MLAGLLAACEPAAPTEADGRAALEQKMRTLFPKAPVISVTFAKTNGTARHVGGVSGYEMRYSATIEFSRGLSMDPFDRDGLIRMGSGFSVAKIGGNGFTNEPHTLIAESVILFQKTERGWAALP